MDTIMKSVQLLLSILVNTSHIQNEGQTYVVLPGGDGLALCHLLSVLDKNQIKLPVFNANRGIIVKCTPDHLVLLLRSYSCPDTFDIELSGVVETEILATKHKETVSRMLFRLADGGLRIKMTYEEVSGKKRTVFSPKEILKSVYGATHDRVKPVSIEYQPRTLLTSKDKFGVGFSIWATQGKATFRCQMLGNKILGFYRKDW